MDMYQKRNMRKKQKEENNNNETTSKTNINWYPRTYGKNKKTNRRRFKTN